MSRRLAPGLLAALLLSLILLGCGRRTTQVPPKAAPPPAGRPGGQYHIDLFKAEPKAGTAVVVLVDTSGSMSQPVRDAKGQMRPKDAIARESLQNIIATTADWKSKHREANLQMAMYTFSSSVSEVLPMGGFDEAKARAALARVPRPNSGTAIGTALEAGFKALYRSGCNRKFLVCVTDGQNTAGPPPDWVAGHLHALTGGEVEMHFVAFDTAAGQFAFLKNVNGHAVEAADGAKLQAELNRIYEDRILVEKEEPGK